MTNKKVELLAPAGNFACFRAAINAGADAVYLGGEKFGARAYAGNFSPEEIVDALRIAHIFGRKIYLTVNTLVKESEFHELIPYIRPFYEAGLDGVIVQDLGVLKSLGENFPGLELIRPMYFVKEASVISWKKHCELDFLNCACKFTEENYQEHQSKSKRYEMKKLIANLRKVSPYIEDSLFKSVANVNLDAVLGYRKGDEKYYFLDDYDMQK